MQQRWTISRLNCDMWQKVDCIRQPSTTSSVIEPRRSFKALPKAKPAPKNVMVTVWWSAVSLIHYTLLDPVLLIWEEHSANWDAPKTAMPAASIGQQNGPDSSPRQSPTTSHTTNTSKIEWIGLWSFASPDSYQLTPTSSSILTILCRENASITSKRQKNAFQAFVKSSSMDF